MGYNKIGIGLTQNHSLTLFNSFKEVIIRKERGSCQLEVACTCYTKFQ